MEPLEVPVEPKSAAVEHVAAPVESVDKGSSPLETPARSSRDSRGLAFSPSGTKVHDFEDDIPYLIFNI